MEQSLQVGTVIKKGDEHYAKFTEGDSSTLIRLRDYPQTHNGLFALSVRNELYACVPGKPTRKLLKPDDNHCFLHDGKEFMLQPTDSGHQVIRVLRRH